MEKPTTEAVIISYGSVAGVPPAFSVAGADHGHISPVLGLMSMCRKALPAEINCDLGDRDFPAIVDEGEDILEMQLLGIPKVVPTCFRNPLSLSLEALVPESSRCVV